MTQRICLGRSLIRHRVNHIIRTLGASHYHGMLLYHTNSKKQVPNLLYQHDVGISTSDPMYAFPSAPQVPLHEPSALSHATSPLEKLTINDQNEELAKWIRNSYIDTPLGNGIRHPNENIPNDNNIVLDASGGGYLYGIPAVDVDTFNIIWRYKFCTGDPHTVDVVVKRINNKRTIFTLDQLLPLLSALEFLERDTDIHKIYESYSIYLRYFLEDSEADLNSDQREKLLELFMSAEARLNNYTNCEVIFSDYIKYSKIKSKVIALGLKAFIENNNLQLAKEFFIQVISNRETFPLDTKDFHSLLLYLNKTANYKSIDYFYQMWLHYQEEQPVEQHQDYSLVSFMHRIYLASRNTEKITSFLNNDTIRSSGYINSQKYHLTIFYDELFRLRKSNANSLEVVEIPAEFQDRIRYFHEQLSSNVQERRSFYLTLLKCFNLCNNLTAIKDLLELIDSDTYINVDNDFHNIIIQYFSRHGEVKNLKDYYRTLFNKKVALDDKSLVLSMAACFESYDPNMFSEFKNEVLTILFENSEYSVTFPWIKDIKQDLDSIHYLPAIDMETCERFSHALKYDDMVRAKELLISRCRDGIMPNVQMFYDLLETCLKDGHIGLASMIDQMIKDMYTSVPHMTTKIQLLWLKHTLMTTVGTQAIKKDRIALVESGLRTEDATFQNLVQLADIYLGIHDFENGQRILTQARAAMCEDDKLQWLMYYVMQLKMHSRALEMGRFIATLREWNANKNASYIQVTTVKLLKSYARYFTKDINKKLEKFKGEEDQHTLLELKKYHETGMTLVNKELIDMGDRYGASKLNTLATMKEAREFIYIHFSVKVLIKRQAYDIKRQELADKFAEFK